MHRALQRTRVTIVSADSIVRRTAQMNGPVVETSDTRGRIFILPYANHIRIS